MPHRAPGREVKVDCFIGAEKEPLFVPFIATFTEPRCQVCRTRNCSSANQRGLGEWRQGGITMITFIVPSAQSALPLPGHLYRWLVESDADTLRPPRAVENRQPFIESRSSTRRLILARLSVALIPRLGIARLDSFWRPFDPNGNQFWSPYTVEGWGINIGRGASTVPWIFLYWILL